MFELPPLGSISWTFFPSATIALFCFACSFATASLPLAASSAARVFLMNPKISSCCFTLPRSYSSSRVCSSAASCAASLASDALRRSMRSARLSPSVGVGASFDFLGAASPPAPSLASGGGGAAGGAAAGGGAGGASFAQPATAAQDRTIMKQSMRDHVPEPGRGLGRMGENFGLVRCLLFLRSVFLFAVVLLLL